MAHEFAQWAYFGLMNSQMHDDVYFDFESSQMHGMEVYFDLGNS
jgi:hypothetical protein